MRELTVELKQLRLHGMASAWADLVEQGTNAALESAGVRGESPARAEYMPT